MRAMIGRYEITLYLEYEFTVLVGNPRYGLDVFVFKKEYNRLLRTEV